MFYKIAIVQNEKEIFKYDCADWSNFIKKNVAFSFYKVSYFDEHDFSLLFDNEKLFIYDALFFSTNSLNSLTIFEECRKNKDMIEKFLKLGKGFYVGYSSKNKSRDFLPDILCVNQIERDFESGESEMDGSLSFYKHPIISSHKKASSINYVKTAKSHTTIAGLYFDYLNLKDDDSNLFDRIVVDVDYNRCLMVCTKKVTGMKLVISTLPIDWQRHSSILLNMIKFCTEGEPEIDIISKKDFHRDDFSNEYLSRQLNLFKRPFVFEMVENIDSIKLSDFTYKTMIFDNSWSEKDIDYFCDKNTKFIANKNIRILHYFNYSTDENPIYKLIVHSSFQQVDLIEESVLVALERKTPDDKNKYSFDSSLLATLEAVTLLKENNMLNENLASKIIEYGKKRLLNNGSYDSMLVASSEFYYIWSKCCESPKEDSQYLKLEKYLFNELNQKKDLITYSEKAQLIFSLGSFSILDEELKKDFLISIFNELGEVNQYNIFNYNIANSWAILSNYFEFMIENKIVTKVELESLSINILRLIGNFKNDCKIVVLSNHVIALTNLLKTKIIIEKNHLQIIYKILFTGISKIFDLKDGLLWNDDIYSSCCALRSLKSFSQLSTYPIDEILVLSQPDSTFYTLERNDNKDFSLMRESIEEQTSDLVKTRINLKNALDIIEEQNKTITELSKDIDEMKQSNKKIENDLNIANRKNKIKGFIDVIGRICLFILVFFIVQMIYVAINHYNDFVNYFISFNAFFSWVIVGISSLMTIISFITFLIKRKK